MIPIAAVEWSVKDIAIVAGRLMRGQILHGPDVQQLTEALGRLVAPRECILTDSGRGALLAIVQDANLPAGAEVLCPSIVCEVAIYPLIQAGLQPVFVDVGQDLTLDPEALAQAVTTRTEAILMAHIYGKICNIAAVERVARRHGLLLIDDAAAACGATYAGRAVGTWGDYGLFSFNYKAISSLMGGAVIAPADRAALHRTVRELPAARSASRVATAALYTIAKRACWPLGHVPLARTTVGRVANVPTPHVGNITLGPISNLCAAAAMHQLGTLHERRRRRRRNAQVLQESLPRQGPVEVLEAPAGDMFTRTVIRVGPPTHAAGSAQPKRFATMRRRIERALARAGIESSRIYRPGHLWLGPGRSCRRAEDLYARCLIVPNTALYGPETMRRIGAAIRRAVQRG